MTEARHSLSMMAMLVIHEDLVAQLYEAYAQLLPEYEGFWSQLVREEVQHTNLLCSVGGKDVSKRDLTLKGLDTSLEYMKVLLANAQRQNMSIRMALSTALQVENSLIEKKLFEVYEGDDAELRSVFSNVTQGTYTHIARIEKALHELK
jgi:hypothetical protein